MLCNDYTWRISVWRVKNVTMFRVRPRERPQSLGKLLCDFLKEPTTRAQTRDAHLKREPHTLTQTQSHTHLQYKLRKPRETRELRARTAQNAIGPFSR